MYMASPYSIIGETERERERERKVGERREGGEELFI